MSQIRRPAGWHRIPARAARSVSGLAAGTTYAFTVTATNPIGSMVSANSLSTTTPDPPAVSFSPPASGASYLFNQKVKRALHL